MEHPFNVVLYGGDYNPEQWPKEIWKEDLRLFDLAGINSATVNVFSWAKLQPSEEEYNFAELDEIIDTLSKANIQIVLATSTGAMPAWLVRKYPEVARVDYEGRRHKFGGRHNACPNSPVFQHYAHELAHRLAERYGSKPPLVCWHVSNEYGGACYCENCEKAFRVWLRKRYGTLDALNAAWNTSFWGHTFYDWDDIVAPNALGDGIPSDKTCFAGMSIDYRRFMSDSLLGNFTMERDAIRECDPSTPITTNLMGTYKGLDYFRWAKEMDIVSWDNYPSFDTTWSMTAMNHDLMRSLKGKPFMLMEQTPSQQNWQPYNSLKRPGQMRAQSVQTLAHGADTIQFFQLRRSKGGCEKFHGAVIEHAGTENARVFREVAAFGKELKNLTGMLGSDYPAKVGMIFDWDNYWALEYTSGPSVDLKYVDQLHRYYRYFYERNIPVDMVPADGDFSRYQIIVAPVLYMCKKGMKEALEAFVANGGVLVTSFMSGIVDESDNVHLGGYPGPLRKLAGVWAEEIDALAPSQTNRVRFADGSEFTCNLLCDILHLEGAETLAVYGDDFYQGTPAVTCNQFGQGRVYYAATQLAPEGLDKLLDEAARAAKVSPVAAPLSGLEIVRRQGDGHTFTFVMNLTKEAHVLPDEFAGRADLLTGKTAEKGLVMQPFDVLILED